MIISLYNIIKSFTFASRDRTNRVVIITRNNCPYSEAMRDLCTAKDLKCADLNEDEIKSNIKVITNQPLQTYPSVYVDGKFIGGFEQAEKYFKDLPVVTEIDDFFN